MMLLKPNQVKLQGEGVQNASGEQE